MLHSIPVSDAVVSWSELLRIVTSAVAVPSISSANNTLRRKIAYQVILNRDVRAIVAARTLKHDSPGAPRILLLDMFNPSLSAEDVLNHMASTVVLTIVFPLTVVSLEPLRHMPPFGLRGVGDGSTDDTTALLAWLAAINANTAYNVTGIALRRPGPGASPHRKIT